MTVDRQWGATIQGGSTGHWANDNGESRAWRLLKGTSVSRLIRRRSAGCAQGSTRHTWPSRHTTVGITLRARRRTEHASGWRGGERDRDVRRTWTRGGGGGGGRGCCQEHVGARLHTAVEWDNHEVAGVRWCGPPRAVVKERTQGALLDEAHPTTRGSDTVCWRARAHPDPSAPGHSSCRQCPWLCEEWLNGVACKPTMEATQSGRKEGSGSWMDVEREPRFSYQAIAAARGLWGCPWRLGFGGARCHPSKRPGDRLERERWIWVSIYHVKQ